MSFQEHVLVDLFFLNWWLFVFLLIKKVFFDLQCDIPNGITSVLQIDFVANGQQVDAYIFRGASRWDMWDTE